MNAHVGPPRAMNFRARSLLAFVLEPVQPVSEWIATLDAWLARSPTFFASKPAILDLAGLDIPLDEYRVLLGDLARRHIRIMAVENPARVLVGPHLPPIVTGGRAVNAPTMPEEDAALEEGAKKPAVERSLTVDVNLRSGQSIVHTEGDVTIVGRVASGAEIIAGGSVHVYGALHGRVIAGASGQPGARIFCTEARAELLCIGGAYLTAEDMDSKFDGRGLEARLEGDKLEIRVLN